MNLYFNRSLCFFFFNLTTLILVIPEELPAQSGHNYMPAKIGWHDAVYDDNKKEPKLVPWTTWDNAIEREMNWYLNAPVNEQGYPSFVCITNIDENYQSRRNDNFPKPKNGDIYVIAHRGAHIGIPENSLAAIQKAIDIGCDYVEIDTRATRDGRIVSVHNATIDQYVTGKTGKVKDYTLSELKQMDIGEKIGQDWRNTRIPTIEEILQLCRGQIGIYLDLKEPLVPELIQIIHKYDMERDIIWYISASRPDLIKELQNLCYQCIPMPDPGEEKNITEVERQVHPQIFASDMSKLSESFVKTAHSNSTKVFVDEEKGTREEWEQIINWGTDGIQTDDPAALIEFLQERK